MESPSLLNMLLKDHPGPNARPALEGFIALSCIRLTASIRSRFLEESSAYSSRPWDETIHRLTCRAAQAYAAPTIEDARRVCLDLGRGGFGTTGCFCDGDSGTVEGRARLSTTACYGICTPIVLVDQIPRDAVRPGSRFCCTTERCKALGVSYILTRMDRRSRPDVRLD